MDMILDQSSAKIRDLLDVGGPELGFPPLVAESQFIHQTAFLAVSLIFFLNMFRLLSYCPPPFENMYSAGAWNNILPVIAVLQK